jgi:hypothetical protein
MTYWIFKTCEQGTYPDIPGEAYVYDNTHSVRVRAGDEFLYLEKAGQKYGLTGAGKVAKVTCRKPGASERHSTRVEKVFTAHLTDVVWFSEVLDLSARSKVGVTNRRLTRIIRR